MKVFSKNIILVCEFLGNLLSNYGPVQLKPNLQVEYVRVLLYTEIKRISLFVISFLCSVICTVVFQNDNIYQRLQKVHSIIIRARLRLEHGLNFLILSNGQMGCESFRNSPGIFSFEL
jgi:hypothetical protein